GVQRGRVIAHALCERRIRGERPAGGVAVVQPAEGGFQGYLGGAHGFGGGEHSGSVQLGAYRRGGGRPRVRDRGGRHHDPGELDTGGAPDQVQGPGRGHGDSGGIGGDQ